MLQNRDLTTLVPITMFPAHTTYITRVLLSPDVKHLATCSADHTVKIWHLDPKHTYSDLLNPLSNPSSTDNLNLNLSLTDTTPASSIIASTNSQALTMNGSQNGVGGGVVPPALPVARGGLPLETTLANHQRWVWDCAFSADSAYLVTVCSDHYARLWELSTSSIIRQYNGHHRGAVCVALNDYSEPR